MSGERALRLAAVVAFSMSIIPAAFGFDPLLAERPIPPNAGSGGISGTQPCEFGALAEPLSLREAVERTLCSNPKTRQTWASVKAQAANVGVARAAYLPTLNGEWQRVRDDSEVNIQNHPELSSSTSATVNSESLSLNWVLFDFGGRKAALKNAASVFDAAVATHDATLQTVFATVAKDYYACEATQGELSAARDVERMTHETVLAAQARVNHGVAPISDALQAETQYEQAVFNLAKAEGESQVAFGTLASDMNLDPGVPISMPVVTDTDSPGKTFSESIGHLIDEVKSTHPSVLAAQAQYEASLAKVEQKRAEGLPRVSLVGKYSRDNQPQSMGLGLQTYPSNGHDAYIGVQITIPLFEGFARHYQVDEARAESERQLEVARQTEQQVALDVWNSYHALATATQNVTNSTNLVAISQQAFRASQERYQHGVGNILELMNTQAALANARERQIQALSDWHSSRIDLASKLGRLELGDADDN
ncbi:Fis family transcriptional regulator (plasmid) [Burkholderia sp. MSMB0856]|uniref:TolC family protein n=1 Tax=Burkholderia sp. MSMB0856 TaxID=1637869 RepID=UPI0008552910|nr:TolC family protein [Burkholderia sp. MSMB0856]AOJ85285.1 Fis family transcriptional regulator [Burkholderia sp. MSMB0856]